MIPYDLELARTWARVMSHARSIGRRLGAGDAWVAATAVKYGIPLLTHDRDYLQLNMPGLVVVCHLP